MEWVNGLGMMTRMIMSISIAMSALTSFNILTPFHFVLIPYIPYILHPWRPLTAALYFGNFSFMWIMTTLMLCAYLSSNELADFKGKPADFAWMMIFIIAVLTPATISMNFPLSSPSLVMSLCWVYCKRHPEARMSLYGFAFNTNIFPWILFACNVIVGGQGIVTNMLGIVAGHAYVFLRDVLPITHNVDLLTTPLWLRRLLTDPSSSSTSAGMHAEVHPSPDRFGTGGWQARNPTINPITGNHRWGRAGRRLGEE